MVLVYCGVLDLRDTRQCYEEGPMEELFCTILIIKYTLTINLMYNYVDLYSEIYLGYR